ncbi:MAG: DUF983 domain-containing protein [Dehalococcoidia bacterium]
MREGITYRRAMALLLAGFVLGRCPACSRASMFRSTFELYERCPNCGVRHQLEDGAWLGAMAIGYGIAALVAMAAAVLELQTHLIARAGLDPMWTIAIASIPVTVLAYRPAKGLWFVLMYLFGLGGEGDGFEANSAPRL